MPTTTPEDKKRKAAALAEEDEVPVPAIEPLTSELERELRREMQNQAGKNKVKKILDKIGWKGSAFVVNSETGRKLWLLHKAAEWKKSILVKYLLKWGIDMDYLKTLDRAKEDYSDLPRTSPLEHACNSPISADIMDQLFEYGADPNLRMHPESILCSDKSGEEGERYLLWYAASQGKPKLVSQLLRANADVHRPTWSGGRSILFLSDNPSGARILLKHGASFLLRDSFGKTALHHAISTDMHQHSSRSGMQICNARLLVEFGADVNVADNAGVTPLLTIFKMLDRIFQMTHGFATDDVLIWKHFDYFVSKGADVNHKDFAGRGIIDYLNEYSKDNWASSWKTPVPRLLKSRLDVNTRLDSGRTLLQELIVRGDNNVESPTYRAIFDHPVDCSLTDRNGWTALHYATAYRRSSVVLDLIKRGLDCNAKDVQGRTPSHLIFSAPTSPWDDVESAGPTMKALLDGGADMTVTDDGGSLPFCSLPFLTTHPTLKDQTKVYQRKVWLPRLELCITTVTYDMIQAAVVQGLFKESA
jgi:ankyrin repeat protein